MKPRAFFIPSVYIALWWGRLTRARNETPGRLQSASDDQGTPRAPGRLHHQHDAQRQIPAPGPTKEAP